MEYTTLGSTGVKVSQLCFGTWKFGKQPDGTLEVTRDEAHELLDAFADAGGNFIDTANSYGGGKSEAWIGDWLAKRDREQFVVASKVYWDTRGRPESSLSRKTIRAEIEGTLDRLGTDYLDLYYIHAWHDESPIKETLASLNDLVREGKIHYLGASNTAAWQLMKSLWTSDRHDYERFEVTQPRFNAAYWEAPADLLDVCADQNLAVCPYSPLEGGFLTGKYDREGGAPEGSRGNRDDWGDRFDDSQWQVLETIEEVADECSVTPAQVSLRWLMDQPRFTCVPIVGARTTDQMAENVEATDVSLSDEQFDRIADAG